MDKQNNLATDASDYTYHEVMVYSAMIQNIFGVQTFSIALLKKALEFMDEVSSDYKILASKFNLPGGNENLSYTETELESAKKMLFIEEKSIHFLSDTRIKIYEEERDKLIRLDENVLNHSLYFESWETGIKYILDNFLEKSKSNPEIESFDNFSKLIHRLQKALQRKNIFTINDLSKYCEKYQNLPIEESRKKAILEIKDLGPKCLDILKEALKEFNFQIAWVSKFYLINNHPTLLLIVMWGFFFIIQIVIFMGNYILIKFEKELVYC